MRYDCNHVAQAQLVASERAVSLGCVLTDVNAVDGAGAGAATVAGGMRAGGADTDQPRGR